MNKVVLLYSAIILTAIFDLVAHASSKKYIEASKTVANKHLLMVIFSYLMLAGLNILMMKMSKFTVAYTLHTLSHIVVIGIAAFIGKLYFKEKYTNREVIGVLLGIASIILLTNDHEHGHGHDH